MNISSAGAGDVQMALLAKDLHAAREQSAAPTPPESAVTQAAATQTNLAVAAQAAGLVDTYA